MDATKEDSYYQYELKGILLHSGGLNRGHYSSIIKNNAEWHLIDDEVSKQIDGLRLEEMAFGGTFKDNHINDIES